MRLHEFILTHRQQILGEWEAFARSCTPASNTMDVSALRDHASEMLLAIAADLGTPQNAFEQSEKSKGRAPRSDPARATAAEEHGAGRAASGFTVDQMVAEYRALRATVLRLWTAEQGELKASDIEDLTRFNEAVDQSLAESVAEFNLKVENAKELFIAMLGHDLRTPLGAIYTSARFLLDSAALNEAQRTLAERIAGSARRTMHMVGDLLDFTRSRLGGGIPVGRAQVDLRRVVQDVVDEVTSAHPEREIQVAAKEEVLGSWDSARICQALTNLIANAVQHSAYESQVSVELRGNDEDVAILIHNSGTVIPAEQLNGIFNPMKARATPRKVAARGPTGSLGLGLFIAERIVSAHGGRIDVESSEGDGTTFTVHLPRGG